MGCNKEPPQDVAHVQFRARIAFKLVWVPNDNFDTFVLVDDGKQRSAALIFCIVLFVVKFGVDHLSCSISEMLQYHHIFQPLTVWMQI